VTNSQQPVPLSQPYYGASIGTAFRRFWSKYATFSGRASRSEYWWWVLISVVISVVLSLLARLGGAGVEDSSGQMTGANGLGVVVGIVVVVYGLAIIVPSIALTVRRLHDANLSGPWILLDLIGIGALVVFIMTLLGPNPAGARFDKA
jgi:uncharacterized membrane protein YhaH (DUF805 family)